MNVHKTFKRHPGRLLNFLCTFNLRPVSTGISMNRLTLKKFLENLYVDDSISGANSIKEGYHFYKKSKDCLLKGGFELRKFHSNNAIRLQQKINQIENGAEPIQSENLKVLGIEWDKFKDTFIIDLHEIFTNGFNSSVTKRNIFYSKFIFKS